MGRGFTSRTVEKSKTIGAEYEAHRDSDRFQKHSITMAELKYQETHSLFFLWTKAVGTQFLPAMP